MGDTNRIHRRGIVLLCLLAIVGAAVLITHWPALSAQAISCDDQQYLVDNYLVRNPGWASIERALGEVLEPSTVAGYYQPLSMISLMLDYSMGGRVDHLTTFHRTSLILHVANTLLVIILLYLLFGEPWPAAVVGLLFGLHPLTVEPIPWVGERKTLLAAFFALAALIAYVKFARTHRRIFFVAAIIGYVLALLSKPTSTPLPLAMLLLDYWPLNRLNRRAVIEKIPLLAIGAVSAVVTFISQNRAASAVLPTEMPFYYSPMRLCHNVIFYLMKMVWPANLTSYYPVPQPFNLSNPSLLAGLIGTLILIAAIVVSTRYSRAFLAGAAIYFVMLLPTVQIIGFSDAMASDKYVYLPSIGVLILLAGLLARWRIFSWPQRRRVGLVVVELALIGVAAAEALATRRYLEEWKDTETLCRHMLSLTPKAAAVHNHLGLYLAGRGRIDDAIVQYQEALQCQPGSVEARNNLGLAYSTKGKGMEAFKCWTRTLQAHQDNFTANYNLGTWFAERGQLNEAHRYLQRAVDLRPSNPEAHTNLATVLGKQGRLDEALVHLRKSVALWPNSARSQHNLATLLLQWGRLQEAVEHYREVVRLQPMSAEAHYNFAEALRQDRKWDEAAREFQEALRINPSHQAARAGLHSLATTQPK